MCTDAATNKKIGVLNGEDDRCGPRLPLMVISPYAKTNYIDHTRTTPASVLKFVEDNWKVGSIGNGSLDKTAGSLTNMFSFGKSSNKQVLLNTNGSVKSITPITKPGKH